MKMDRLWAPWRIKYLKMKKTKGCIFCLALKKGAKSELILETKSSLAMLNIFPYNNGHLLISPKRHVRELSQLRHEEILDLFSCLDKSKKLLDKVLGPEGYNIGINIGKSSGAGIPGHLHIHLVPRWTGDTNFMPALFNAKIISQSLEELKRRLKSAQSKSD